MSTINSYMHIIQNDGKIISWDHIEKLYSLDSGSKKDTAGLYLVPKLKYEHVFLSSFSKMRVDLAAQVRIVNNMQWLYTQWSI